METSFLFEMWNQSHSFRGILLVIIAICFFWAIFYSKSNHNLRLALKGILITIIAICLLMIIAGGGSPSQLAVMGIAIVCFSLMPKKP